MGYNYLKIGWDLLITKKITYVELKNAQETSAVITKLTKLKLINHNQFKLLNLPNIIHCIEIYNRYTTSKRIDLGKLFFALRIIVKMMKDKEVDPKPGLLSTLLGLRTSVITMIPNLDELIQILEKALTEWDAENDKHCQRSNN